MVPKVVMNGVQCTVEFARYANGQTRIQLWCDEGPYCTATVAVKAQLPAGCVAIKDYAENAGVLSALINAGIVDPVLDHDGDEVFVPAGFELADVCRLLVDPCA